MTDVHRLPTRYASAKSFEACTLTVSDPQVVLMKLHFSVARGMRQTAYSKRLQIHLDEGHDNGHIS